MSTSSNVRWTSLRVAPLIGTGVVIASTGLALVNPLMSASSNTAALQPRVVTSQDIALTADQGLIGQFIGFFISNGTAERPDAGLLIGDGYSYSSFDDALCANGCNGGRGGLLFGNGGNGWNGGNGGNAGFFGGNGGNGGAGVDAQYDLTTGALLSAATRGGRGGSAGLTGNGGNGGTGGSDSGSAAVVGASGASGGRGGRAAAAHMATDFQSLWSS